MSGHARADAQPVPRRRQLDVSLQLPGGRMQVGCKGPGALAWLQAAGLSLPAEPNTFTLMAPAEGEPPLLIARLGGSEFFLEAAAGTVSLLAVAAALEAPPAGVYPVLREDWTLRLAGQDVHDVLVQVCNVNFSALSPGTRPVVMTLMIGVGVVVVPEIEGQAAYRIWCDPSYGPYLSETLGSIVTEYGGWTDQQGAEA